MEIYNDVLLGTGIPKWLEGKLIDKTFTKDVKLDAKPLLFSKGNFMKSISLTTKEIRNNDFCAVNAFILEESKVIYEMATSADLEVFFTADMTGEQHEIEAEYLKLQWPMLGTDTVEELLEPRINRHKVTGFSDYLPPKPKPGQADFRPETTQKREVRLLKNKIGQMLNVYLNLFHFIPLVDDPIKDFWLSFFPEANRWTITPESQIYNWIDDEDTKIVTLGLLRNLETDAVKQIARKMVLIKLGIPDGSPRAAELTRILDGLGENTPEPNYGGFLGVTRVIATLKQCTMDDLKRPNGTLTREIREEVDLFRGKVTAETLKSGKEERDMVGSGNLVDIKAKRVLRYIEDDKLRASITEWIRDSFSGAMFQLLAAKKAAAAVEVKDLGYNIGLEEEDESSDSESDDSWN
jgi:hypothetical protein